jgi:4-amino-4-deoxy-L-arabinose transferase-like glycosyltransferase
MTSRAAELCVTTSDGIVAAWNAVATRSSPIAVIVVAWVVLAVPLVFFRGFNSDEGLTVSIARTALENGDWLNQHTFNVRWIDSPRLLAWIIAAISEPFGHVSQITARLPIVCFLLFGCLLIYFLLRKVGAGVAAALFGTALFLACPLVMRAYVMITADMPLAVLLFFAFVLWWSGCEKGSISVSRWLAIGLVLAIAGLLKGPQLMAYFVLGVGVFVLASRSWRQIFGLVLAGLIGAIPLAAWYAAIYTPGDEAQWSVFMRVQPRIIFSGPLTASVRLLGDTLPAALFAAVYLVARGFRGRAGAPPAFVAALACYAFIAAPLILFWPGGSAPRYYFPMVLPLCVFGGLGYDALAPRRPEIVAPLLLLTAGLLVYALGYSVASPLLPMRFRPTQIEAARIAGLVQAAPGPIYRTGDTALNVLPYVPGRILNASLNQLGTLPGPAWMVLPAGEAEALLARRPDKLHAVMAFGEAQQWRLLRLDP